MLFHRLITSALFASSLISVVTAHAALEPTSEARTRYIVDRIYVALREDADESSRVTARSLRSGTELKLIDENKESGYSYVTTDDGVKGWIKTQYLQAEETAALRLPELEKQLAELSQKNDAGLLKELESTRKENQKLQADNESLQKDLSSIQHASSNVIKINDRNKEMIEKNQILQSDMDTLEAINEQLKSDQSTTYFIYGGLLVILTIVMMLVYDGIKRKRSYGSEW